MLDKPMDWLHRIKLVNMSAFAGGLLGLAMVLLLRRYAGITHDSMLYLAQGLLHRWPEIYAEDLFFVHGSQENYSLFPLLLGLSFQWLEPAAVFLIGTLTWLILFAVAAWYCLRALLPQEQRVYAWLGVLCLPTMYGMTMMFSYSESFLTPRPIAEAMCLFGVGLLAGQRMLLAFVCLATAALFHPLQAIAAALIVWPWLVMQDRRWLHVAWLTVPIILLAVIGIPPFNDLFTQIDQTWLTRLHDNTPQLFVTAWHDADFNILALDVFLLTYGWRVLRGHFGTWCLAALVGLALGFIATLLLVDALHLVLPAELQLWRVHWLAHWLAMATVAIIVMREFARDIPRALLFALTCLLAWNIAGWVWLPLAGLYAMWPRIFGNASARLAPLLGWIFAVAILGLFVYHFASELLPFRMAHYRLDLYAFDRRLLVFPPVAFGLPLLGVYLWRKASINDRWLLLILVLLPMIGLGVMRWDARPLLNLAVERNTFQLEIFGTSLPTDAQVYWESDSLIATWLVLQRASYFNQGQLAGQIFSRATALDGEERFVRMSGLLRDSIKCQDRSRPFVERQSCHISDQAMRQACAPSSIPYPDYIVLPYLQPQHALGEWVIMDPVVNEPAITFWLYRCIDVMDDLQKDAGTASSK